ncbi:antirestriction protein ArdA [Streptomyces alfalfae]|uniref:antirestriction protein ArdA n=1 Tax=Streptomyces alfalfae TaxID=1642299 RepID=UPI001BA9074E|nr:antirestriction protein ArdA [Streptomyces alfalfae]QUI30709.1 antirestriction protein ArdA [Streptomyces alfalfae]
MPSIYVASLTDYNHGELHGAWIDADQEPDAILEEVQAMLAESPTAKQYGTVAEEWRIDDSDDFWGVEIGEWDSFERVSAIADLMTRHPGALVAYFLEEGHEPEKIEDLISDRFSGEYEEDTEIKAVAAHYMEQLEDRKDIPEDIRDHLGALARDMAEGDLNGGVWQTVEVRRPGGRTFYLLSV